MQPRISVVMPTYNRSRVVANAVRSIIDQTYKDWELIVVDDGSTDGTRRIVESFANPRIVFKEIPHCGFVSKVRNEGNKIARGEIIVVQDSDDISLPDRLEEIVKIYDENPDVDVVYHGMYLRFVDPYHNCITRGIRQVLPYDKQHLLTEQYIPGQIAYKKKCILETPYDERVRCCDDYQMLIEFALKDYKFMPIYKNLYEYFDSGDSINVSGEMDGSRKRDVEIILQIMKEKYNVEARAAMIKNTVDTGEVIDRQIIQ